MAFGEFTFLVFLSYLIIIIIIFKNLPILALLECVPLPVLELGSLTMRYFQVCSSSVIGAFNKDILLFE